MPDREDRPFQGVEDPKNVCEDQPWQHLEENRGSEVVRDLKGCDTAEVSPESPMDYFPGAGDLPSPCAFCGLDVVEEREHRDGCPRKRVR